MVLVGTCGYSYPEWKGVFYPEGTKSEDFLSSYAARFPLVEVDSTFYHMPTAKRMERMLLRSGELKFSLKAPRGLTHEIDDWKHEALLFKEALVPMVESGRLSAVLFQFPQSFRYIPENRFYLSFLLDEFQGTPAVVEFREQGWMRESVRSGLDGRGVGLCVSDYPRLSSLPRLSAVSTGGIGYLRLHGRNPLWYEAGPKRYDYTYSEGELKDLVPVIEAIDYGSKVTHVLFNNHPGGGAPVNALALEKLLAHCE